MSLGRSLSGALDRIVARAALRSATRVGADVRIIGWPNVSGGGEILVGPHSVFVATPAPVTILVSPGGSLTFGPSCLVESGVTFRVSGRVVLGAGVRIGAGSIVDDQDGESVGQMQITVGDEAWIEDGAVILAGAEVRPREVVSGRRLGVRASPRQVTENGFVASSHFLAGRASADGADLGLRVLGVVARVVPGAREVDRGALLGQVKGWDSLAALRILVSLEKEFGIVLPGDLLAERPTLALVAEAIAARIAPGAEVR